MGQQKLDHRRRRRLLATRRTIGAHEREREGEREHQSLQHRSRAPFLSLPLSLSLFDTSARNTSQRLPVLEVPSPKHKVLIMFRSLTMGRTPDVFNLSFGYREEVSVKATTTTNK